MRSSSVGGGEILTDILPGSRSARKATTNEMKRELTAPQELQVLPLWPEAPHLGQSVPCILTFVVLWSCCCWRVDFVEVSSWGEFVVLERVVVAE
jgi:hypothetical protein